MTAPTYIVDSTAALQKDGHKLLATFYAAIQAMKLFPLENQTVQKALDDLHTATMTVVRREGEVELVAPGSLPNDGKVIADERTYT